MAIYHIVGAVHVGEEGSYQLRRQAKQGPISAILPVDTPKDRNQRVMDAISKFRAEVCYKMKKEHNKDFASYEACDEFMTEACHPGKDEKMDGDKKEVTSGEGFCKEYFPEAKRKAEEEVDKEDKEKAAKIEVAPVVVAAPAPGPAGAPGPAPAAAKAPAPAPAVAGPGPAPAPGPMGAPGPAPVPGPFIPGITGGKPWGPIDDDEAYYFKKNGQHPDRLHMNADLKLPTQGYWGKLVEHEDQKTFTEDWGHEFGPTSGHDSFRAICAKNPDNPWCYENGYHRRHKGSSASICVHILPLVLAIFATRVV